MKLHLPTVEKSGAFKLLVSGKAGVSLYNDANPFRVHLLHSQVIPFHPIPCRSTDFMSSRHFHKHAQGTMPFDAHRESILSRRAADPKKRAATATCRCGGGEARWFQR